MTSTSKFCCDCQHYVPYASGYVCASPALGRDLVTCAMHKKLCADMRTGHIPGFPVCGPSGLLFEQRGTPDTPPLDLDAMADAARARLARFIDTRAKEEHARVAVSFDLTCIELDIDPELYSWARACGQAKPRFNIGAHIDGLIADTEAIKTMLKGFITPSQRIPSLDKEYAGYTAAIQRGVLSEREAFNSLSPFPLTGLL